MGGGLVTLVTPSAFLYAFCSALHSLSISTKPWLFIPEKCYKSVRKSKEGFHNFLSSSDCMFVGGHSSVEFHKSSIHSWESIVLRNEQLEKISNNSQYSISTIKIALNT